MLTQEKDRQRCWNLLLYPEDSSHVLAIEKIKQSYDYALCLHDRDIEEDGTIKKPHWHVVLRFKNQVWNTALAKDLGIGVNYIQKPRSFDNSLMYLIHYNDPEKAQYDISEVHGNIKTKLKELINTNNKTEGEKVVEIIQYIKDYNGYIKVTEFAEYCASNGYWSEFRRSGAIFLKIIEEHNKKYC